MVEYIGVDIGGTNIRVGAIDENENIVFEYIEPTFKDVETENDLYEKIEKLIMKIPNYNKAFAIGIGIPGLIDENKDKILISGNVSFLEKIPLKERLQVELDIPVYIENDARVAGLAEAVKGRGKDKDIVCYITISTGLGGGIIVKKEIYSGSSNLGGYFSDSILDGTNKSDSLISGTAITNMARKRISSDIKGTLQVFELAEKGNIVANEIIEEFKKNLMVLLLNISIIVNPDMIVLGGGVLKSKVNFLQEVIDSFKKHALPLAKNTIIDTALLEEPGILGAALVAKKENSKEGK